MEIPTRADVPETDKWDLTYVFADVSKWQEDFAWLQREYPKLERWKGRVGESAQTLAGLLEFEKALEQKMERVYHYASLQAAEDSTNNEYLARIGQVQNLLTRISEAAAFVVPEILAIDDERIGKFRADPALKDWAIKLHKIRRMRPHVLSVPEERLLALSNVALSGYDDTFSQLTDVDMKFGALRDETGREKPLTQSSFSSFLVKRDPALRKRAFEHLDRVLGRRDRVQALLAVPARTRGVHDPHDHALHAKSALGDLGDDQVRVIAVGRGDEHVGARDPGLLERVDLQRRADRELAAGVLPAQALARVQALVGERILIEHGDFVTFGQRRLGDGRADAPCSDDQQEHGAEIRRRARA